MPERSPILSAKNDGRQIGFIEGNEVFDLLGRRRASSNGRTGNLCALDSGKIIGHVSLQGNFVGVSWIADELFSISDGDTHKEAVRKEGYLHRPGVAGDIIKPRDAEAAYAVHGIGETPRPSSSERGEPTVELSSKSDGNTYRDILRAASFLNGPGVAGESFESRDAKATHAVRSIGETSSPPAFEQGEPAAELFSKSWMAMLTRKAVRKEGYLNGPGLVVAGEIIEPRDAEAAYADHGREMPSPPPSKQGKLTAELSSKSDDTHQETLRGDDTLNGTSLAVAGEIFGRRDVEAPYADHSSGETRSPQPSKQDEPAADLSSKSDDHTHQDIRRGGGLPNGPSLAVADESFGRRDVGAAYADYRSGQTQSPPPPSKQDEPAADLSSKSDDNTHQDIGRGGGSLNGPSLTVADEIFGRRDVEAAYADHSSGQTPSPPAPPKQDEPTAELSSKSGGNMDQDILRGEDPLNGPSLAVADEIIEPRDAGAAYPDHSIGEMPSLPPSEQDEPEAELFSKSWMAMLTGKAVRKEGYLNGPGLVVAGEAFGQADAEDAYAVSVGEAPRRSLPGEIFGQRDVEADPSSGQTPSQPPPFEQGEAPTELFSKSDGNTQRDGEESLSGLGPAVAGDIIEPWDVETAYADRSIGEMFSLLLSQQGEPAAELFSKFDINTHRQTLRQEDPLNGPSLAGADEIIEPRDVEAGYADHGSGEMPSPPPSSERREPAAVTISPEERSAPDPTADFFSVDMERAVEMVRRKLGGESYNNDPGLVEVGELSDPTAAFLSVDEERAVGIVRREFGSEDYPLDPGAVAAGELPDPTKDFFSVDVDRAVEMLRRALEKGAL
jgi:hypothetical protein